GGHVGARRRGVIGHAGRDRLTAAEPGAKLPAQCSRRATLPARITTPAATPWAARRRRCTRARRDSDLRFTTRPVERSTGRFRWFRCSHRLPPDHMIIITAPHVTDAQLDGIREAVERAGLRTHLSRGTHRTIIGCIGDERRLADAGLASLPGVESVIPVLKPYRQVSREFRADPTVVRVGDAPGAAFGGDALAV